MVVDMNALESYRDIMGDDADTFIADVIDTYIRSAADLLYALQAGIPANDVKSFVRAAHTLKSSSAAVGAMVLSTLSAELEQLPESTLLPELASKVDQAWEEFTKVTEELVAIRKKLG